MNGSATVFVFEFQGKDKPVSASNAPLASDSQHDANMVPTLNKEAMTIAEDIRSHIRRNLPAGVSVEVQIEFQSGSLEWTGVVLVLDFMGTLAGAMGLADYLKRIIQFSVNRVLRSGRFISPGSLKEPVTEVSETSPRAASTASRTEGATGDSVNRIERPLWAIAGAVALLLIATIGELIVLLNL